MNKKIYNLNISLIRAFFCIAILLYHLDILKGGFLAVCSFFVLTGYFMCISLCKKPHPGKHYLKRIKKIYLPLLIIVFLTISLINLFNINIFNFKPEITSILFGYNNYWQLGANVDYFAKHINSPFSHLWYIAILLQIELIFPFIFLFLKKSKEKLNKYIPIIIVFLLSILSVLYFYYNYKNGNIMFAYYDTFSRLFSFLLGILLGLIHTYFKPISSKVNSKIMILFYLIILFILFIFISSSSKYFFISMIITTIITLRLIDHACLLYNKGKNINIKPINFIADISYEIYLIQYPIIYLFMQIKMPSFIKIILIILLTILLSWIIHFSLKFIKKDKNKILKLILRIILFTSLLYGIYTYISMKDYTNEINTIKKELNNNQKLMEQKQKEYKEKQAQEEKNWNEYLENLDKNSVNIDEYLSKLKVVGVGDSVMLDAIPGLYEIFPNGYFDAKVSRSTYAAYDVLEDIINSGITFDALIFNLGTNGETYSSYKDNLMSLAGNKDVFWLTATCPDYDDSNEELINYAQNHSNIHILYWDEAVKNHTDYLYDDYTHLKPDGLEYYVSFIKEEISKYYKSKFDEEKNNIINKHNEEEKNKITFYGDELLTYIFDELQKEYTDSEFITNNSIDNLTNMLNENKDKLSNTLIFAFNKISKSDYEEIIKICDKSNIYIITTSNLEKTKDNITIINLDKKSYFIDDKIHLSDKGKQFIINKLSEIKK